VLAFRIRVVDTGAGRGRPGDARAMPE
jgi:hypothetical protein